MINFRERGEVFKKARIYLTSFFLIAFHFPFRLSFSLALLVQARKQRNYQLLIHLRVHKSAFYLSLVI